MDARTEATLQEIVRREYRSLLQYVGESFPWATADKSEALDRLHRLVVEEQAAAGEVARFLQRRHVTVPPLAPYPMDFTSLAFVSLDYLLPRLIEHQRRNIAQLERDLRDLTEADARGVVQKLLETKRSHRKVLDELTSTAPAAAV
jgi:hypothetical protein